MYFGNLPEEFLIILIDEKSKKLTVKNDILVQFGLVGSCLLELTIRGRLAFAAHKIIIVDETPVDDPLLQEVMDYIMEEEDEKTARYWLRFLSDKLDDLKKRLIHRLEDRGIVEVRKEKKWFFFEEEKYSVLKKEMEETIIQQVHDVVHRKEEADPRTLAFLSLIYASGATGQIFTNEEIDKYLTTIRGMVDDEEIGKSITDSIRMITDALMRSQIINYGHFMA